MNIVRLNIDKSHSLGDPDLHDGTLVGIGLRSEARVEIVVADESKTRYLIILEGVVRINAMEFREVNSILDVTVIRGEDVRLADLVSLQYVGQTAQHAEEYLKWIHGKILQESLYVIEINPSYGCHLIGVAEDIHVEPIQE
jgi:hypothetical protein